MSKKPKVNSCYKGKASEREAARLLRDMGFTTARRTQQHCGKVEDGAADLVCTDLPNIHFEIKDDKQIKVGTAALVDAMAQAFGDAFDDAVPVVLWKEYKKPDGWRLSWSNELVGCAICTVAGKAAIRAVLNVLHERNEP